MPAALCFYQQQRAGDISSSGPDPSAGTVFLLLPVAQLTGGVVLSMPPVHQAQW